MRLRAVPAVGARGVRLAGFPGDGSVVVIAEVHCRGFEWAGDILRVVEDGEVGWLEIVVEEMLFAGRVEPIIPEGSSRRFVYKGGGAYVDVFECEGEVGNTSSRSVV